MIASTAPCSSMSISFVTGSLACLVLFSAVTSSRGDGGQPQAGVPLKKVVLFNSGVGFFEHDAEIEGDAHVDFKFNVENVNDLLKSLVLQDLGGGRISTVTYGSRDPITKTLKTFAVDLTANPTLAQLLDQIRGEQVELDAPNPVTGTIVGVEHRRRKAGDEVLEVDVLNLLTAEGLRSVQLESVGRIKLANPELDGELRQALAVLALGHATDKKTVTLNFLGQGKRPVRVGYIQETPIWKTSYRLVLDDEEPPFLQGWALVENTTEEDWQDVALTLVSGRPISFVMDLYQPLYVPRPVVEPELFASLRPQTYGQDLAEADQLFEQAGGQAAKSEKFAGARRERMGRAMALAPAAGPMAAKGADREAMRALAESAPSLAQAGEVGELFQYVIDMPVSLPRQQSAMLPIVNGSVRGEKVSIYNPSVQPKHPLSGLRLKNTTELHLMQGPITVFDGGTYAGDARIEDLSPGSERLISYALDLQTEVAVEVRPGSDALTSCKLVKGILHTSRKYQRRQEYTIKNSGPKAKRVLIEQPFDPAWKLVEPKQPAEKTRELYRFAVTAEPGKAAKLPVAEERTAGEQVAVTNLDDNMIRFYLQAPVVSEKVKQALAEVVERKQKLQEIAAARQQLEQQVATIDQEQSRIRQNMAQLERNSDLYRRYVKKFGEQEDQIEKLRGQIHEAQADEERQRKEFDQYLAGLDLS